MKPIVLLASLLLLLTSCSEPVDEALYGNAWELEYITGPKIAFWALYPDRKPAFQFNAEKHLVDGQNSCNGYMAPVVIEGHTISFGEPGPTTMTYCGQGEVLFLTTIKKVNGYRITSDGFLELMMDDMVMMRFKNVANASGLAEKHMIPPALKAGCYGYHKDGNSITLEVNDVVGDRVSGTLTYALSGKDKNTGIFSGTVRDGKLVGRYRFSSEGADGKRQVAFQIQDSTLIEGFGPMDERGISFKNLDSVQYNSTMPLTKDACKKADTL